jgi:hypothetical protein
MGEEDIHDVKKVPMMFVNSFRMKGCDKSRPWKLEDSLVDRS